MRTKQGGLGKDHEEELPNYYYIRDILGNGKLKISD
jgi:hypothetical protein